MSLLKEKRAEGKSSGYTLIEEVGEAQQSDLVPREQRSREENLPRSRGSMSVKGWGRRRTWEM